MTHRDFDPLSLLDAPSDDPVPVGDGPRIIPTGQYEVTLPSGATFDVLTADEAEQLTKKVEEYTSQYSLENVADLGDLDIVIQLELMVHRMTLWFSRRYDYDGKRVDENQLAQRAKEISGELRQRKKLLGIDKVARDRARGEGSVHERMTNLLARAERFGIHRNKQSAKAIELAMELISMRNTSRNCPDDKMRKRLAVTDQDIMSWVDTYFTKEFQQLDIDYRNSDQRTWIRSMSSY